jgi:hypothetical protein
MLNQYIIGLRAFFDRNYNLLFNRQNCIKIKFYEELFDYNGSRLGKIAEHKTSLELQILKLR